MFRSTLMAAVAVAVLLAGCSGGSTAAPSATAVGTTVAGATSAATTVATQAAPTSTAAVSPVTGKVVAFAASSLTDVFKAVGEAFTKANPGATVEFNFQSSSALATQIEQGAPADVFASADTVQMQRLVDKGLIGDTPQVFVRNKPVIVIPAENRAQIASPADLARPGVKLLLAASDVPIGAYARQVIDRLAADPAYGASYREKTLANIVSNEANVRAVLTKIELGEADAGVVYRTDALLPGPKVKTIPFPDAANVIATYPIATVKSSTNAAAARAFVAFIRGAEGQKLLQAAGFDAP